MTDPHAIAAKLCPLEKERLTGWKGPAGAAYNAISEDLCEAGLFDRGWRHTALGLEVRAVIKEQDDAE